MRTQLIAEQHVVPRCRSHDFGVLVDSFQTPLLLVAVRLPNRKWRKGLNFATMTILWIALGGALGSVLRYAIGGAVQKFSARGFPVGTMAVNVIGCLIVGILLQRLLNTQAHPAARAFMVVGFCAGALQISLVRRRRLAASAQNLRP